MEFAVIDKEVRVGRLFGILFGGLQGKGIALDERNGFMPRIVVGQFAGSNFRSTRIQQRRSDGLDLINGSIKVVRVLHHYK